jgi:hypothetical protein
VLNSVSRGFSVKYSVLLPLLAALALLPACQSSSSSGSGDDTDTGPAANKSKPSIEHLDDEASKELAQIRPHLPKDEGPHPFNEKRAFSCLRQLTLTDELVRTRRRLMKLAQDSEEREELERYSYDITQALLAEGGARSGYSSRWDTECAELLLRAYRSLDGGASP